MIVTQRELAELFDVSPRTIRRWGDDGLDAARTEDGYDLRRAIAWRLAELDNGADDAMAEARIRRLNALARRSELLADEEAGDLIRRADLDEVVGKLIGAVRRAADQLPARWGPRVVGLEDVAEGTARIEELRAELLGSLRDFADGLDADADAIEG